MPGIYDETNTDRFAEKAGFELSPKEIQARAVSRRGLFTELDIIAALGSGQSPIELSIQKWQKIRKVVEDRPTIGTLMGLSDYIGYKSCALCLRSIEIFKTSNGDLKDDSSKCTVCPLATIEPCVASNSAYSQIDKAVISATYASSSPEENLKILNQFKENLEKLLANLEKLRLDT